nr:1446_t:CDS:2 [Entrophospora candida]
MDLGPCPKIHSEKLKSEYEEAKKQKRSAQKRLDKTPEDNAKITQLTKEIENLASEISELTKEVEVLGEEGKVTESMDRLHEVDIKKGQKADKEKELKNTMEGGSPSQQQKLRVCEVCSAYLSIFDSDRRLADHFGGKMHLGYLKIRDLLKELKEKNRDQVATAVPDLRDEGRMNEDIMIGDQDQSHLIDVVVGIEDVQEVHQEEDIKL